MPDDRCGDEIAGGAEKCLYRKADLFFPELRNVLRVYFSGSDDMFIGVIKVAISGSFRRQLQVFIKELVLTICRLFFYRVSVHMLFDNCNARC